MTRRKAISHLHNLSTVKSEEIEAIEMAVAALKIDLQPCPFCDNKVEFVESEDSEDGHGHFVCGHCIATFTFLVTDETAINMWNMRSPIF